MSETLRFHLDECLTVQIAKMLALRGRDCTTPKDAGMIAAADADHWGYAKQEKRVVITADQDFLRLAATDRRHPGVIYWTKSRGEHFAQLVRRIDAYCVGKTPDDVRGIVVYL